MTPCLKGNGRSQYFTLCQPVLYKQSDENGHLFQQIACFFFFFLEQSKIITDSQLM